MRNIKKIIQQKTSEAMQSLFGAAVSPEEVQLQETRKEFTGDFTVVVFPLTRQSKKSPQETADALGKYLVENIEEAVQFEVVKGFLNILLSDNFWKNYLQNLAQEDEDETWEKVDVPQKIMVEYSSPNTNKPLHLGHIRNNLLGYSVAEILKARGHNVIKANLINDRGIHICKSMLAWMKAGGNETPDNANIKGDHLVGKYYVEFDKQYKQQIQQLTEQGISKEEAEKKAPLMLEAQEMLRKWEAGDEETIAIWRKMNNWVYEGFDQTYKSLGVDFDNFYYESNTYLLGKDIVQEGLEKGVFYKKEDGSVWIDLTDEGLDEKLVLRSDGTSVYITQDLGTAQQRFEENDLDRLIYVVGNEQDYHFKVLQLIFKKFGKSWWNTIYHLSYGMVDLPSGKMKSREGTVVDADDLIAEMIKAAGDTTKELGKIEGLNVHEQEELFRKIGMAALKFFILKVDPRKRMLFNPEESIDFQGFTGPFVQYTYARIKSILRKADAEIEYNPSAETTLKPEEKDLLQLIYKKDDILHEAENGLSPAVLANYAYDLAKSYNKFYHEHSVLNEPNEEIKAFRLALSEKTAQMIKETMLLLGIEVPERM